MFEKEFLGIDIGDKTIKFVLSKHYKNKKVLTDYFITDIQQTEEDHEKNVFGTIETVLKVKKWMKKKINLIISSKEVIQRGLKIPEIPKTELDAVVDREVKKLLGDIKGKKVGYQIMGTETMDERSFYTIFFILAPEVFLDKIADLNFKVNMIDFKLFAFDRIYQKTLQDKTNSVIIDIGHLDTVLMIYKGKNLDIYREINSGGAEITQAIANMLQIDFTEAEMIKRTYGYISKDEAARLLETEPRANQINFSYQFVMDKILRKIKMSIDYFKTQNRGEEISKVYLCGGGAELKGFDGLIKDELGNVEIIIYDGLDNFEIKNKKENYAKDALKLMGAMGTALMEKKIINFGQNKKKGKLGSMKLINKIITVIAVIPLLAAFGFGKYMETQYGLELQKYNNLNNEMLSLVTSYDNMENDIAKITSQEIGIDKMLTERSKVADILYDLSDITADNLFFETVDYRRDSNEVALKGFGISNDGFPEISINNFLHKLEDKYKEVHLLGTKKSENKQAAEFDISFKTNDAGGDAIETK